MKRFSVLVVPAVLVFLFVLSAPAVFGQPERRPATRGDWLNLTPEQKTKLEELRQARQEEMRGTFEQMRKLRLELRDLMKDPEANEKKIESLIDELSRLRANQMKSGFEHRLAMRKILTPEQLAKWKDVGPRMGRMMPGPLMRRGFRRGLGHSFGPEFGPMGRPFFPRWRW